MAVGSDHAARAGQTMQEIVDSVRRVTDIMGEISTASVEQSSGLEQINQAIAQMDGVTQQNATLVQDLGNTVRSLTGEANDLQHSINVLNTGKKAGSALVAQARSEEHTSELQSLMRISSAVFC